jgi:hypothetical protein
MASKWLQVPLMPLMRAQQVVNRGKPLTQSYPVGAFFVTARNNAAPAPGQPSGMTRFSNPGSGDPRANGSYFDIKASSQLQSLLTGTPLSVVGGSNITNAAAGSSDNTFLWMAVGGLVLAFIYWDS